MDLKPHKFIGNSEKLHSLLCILERSGALAGTCGAAEVPSDVMLSLTVL